MNVFSSTTSLLLVTSILHWRYTSGIKASSRTSHNVPRWTDVQVVVATAFARWRANRQVRAGVDIVRRRIPGVNLTAVLQPSTTTTPSQGMPRISRQMSFPPISSRTCFERVT